MYVCMYMYILRTRERGERKSKSARKGTRERERGQRERESVTGITRERERDNKERERSCVTGIMREGD